MKMKVLLSVFICFNIIAPLSAAENTTTNRLSIRAILQRRNGGSIIEPNSGAGRIVYVNAQKRAPREWLEEIAAQFSNELCVNIDVEEGQFQFPSPEMKGEAVLFVIDDPAMPSLLHAPEQRWTMVNVAPLTTGRGAKPAFFAARVKKELTRGFSLLAGTQTSNYPDSLLGSMTKPEELDTFANTSLPVDIKSRFVPYLSGLGIKPYNKTTYRRACQEGWAPAPTNDVQKAIWDEFNKQR